MKKEYIYETELYHYGVLGQKWGIRRYENYDGSYTQAGVKRYKESKRILDVRKNKYKEAKANGVSGYELKNLKANVKAQKRQVNNDYKRLKNDKMADKGKIRYKNGERITEKKTVNRLMNNAGYGLISAAYLNANYKFVKAKPIKVGNMYVSSDVIMAAAGVALRGASYVKSIIDEIPNNELRAYYSHSSR